MDTCSLATVVVLSGNIFIVCGFVTHKGIPCRICSIVRIKNLRSSLYAKVVRAGLEHITQGKGEIPNAIAFEKKAAIRGNDGRSTFPIISGLMSSESVGVSGR